MKKIIISSKAAIKCLIVALLFISVICGVTYRFAKEKFELAVFMINMVTIDQSEVESITPILKDGTLINYPTYGSKYGTIKIDSADIELPVYYGANYQFLKSGIVHDERSSFPGEGKSIILAGHNFKSFLANLPKAKIGDKIEFNTTYGDFKYEIYDTQIVSEYDTDKVPIQDKEEILMIYTCWPIGNIGHASERYVVYAKVME